MVGDPRFAEGRHQARVEVTLKSRKDLTKQVDTFRGKAENPLTTEEVEKKAEDLIEPVLGAQQTRALIETIRDLERLPKARDLRPLLAMNF